MKYVISVSKKRNSVWRIYYYGFDEDGNFVFQSKRINRLLVPFYKIGKFHRKKMYCDECERVFTWLTNWRNKPISECPYCFEV